jgi:hypothetical protein
VQEEPCSDPTYCHRRRLQPKGVLAISLFVMTLLAAPATPVSFVSLGNQKCVPITLFAIVAKQVSPELEVGPVGESKAEFKTQPYFHTVRKNMNTCS